VSNTYAIAASPRITSCLVAFQVLGKEDDIDSKDGALDARVVLSHKDVQRARVKFSNFKFSPVRGWLTPQVHEAVSGMDTVVRFATSRVVFKLETQHQQHRACLEIQRMFHDTPHSVWIHDHALVAMFSHASVTCTHGRRFMRRRGS
jgi:hypothetical protein